MTEARGRARPGACVLLHGNYPQDSRVQREVRVMVDLGYDVDVFAMAQNGLPARETVEGVRVFRLPVSHRHGGGLPRTVLEYLGFAGLVAWAVTRPGVRRRYDVVHVNNPPDFLVFAAMVPKLLGARVILDIHDLSPEMFHQRFDGRRGAGVAERVLRGVERLATRFADEVVTVHEPYRRELIGRGVPQRKLTVVMNTVDERVLPEPVPAAARNGDGSFRVVYHGTVTPLYGVELLVDAAAQVARDLPALRLEVYGAGDAVPSVRRRADEVGMTERLVLSGDFIAHPDMLRLVRGAAVGVIPNLPVRMNVHALPTKLFEYVTLGVPVVCADLPTIREHFTDDELLFYRAGDRAALAAALLEVAANPDAAARRAAAALERYQAAYRWTVSARRYARLFPIDRHRNGLGAAPPA
jgi:glycosyltransferase involved in cell wall biosynthesis